jgi:3-(3-hydroxy-phenyl)propionate hydroxylase
MSTQGPYDVAIIGYGPTGATAANLLGQAGLKVVVIERDPDIYNRARAISTDEEVLRIWQSIGLADRLQLDMLAGRPVAFLDTEGRSFIETVINGRGCGHPAQQFLYQPAVDTVLRDGAARFGNVEVLLEHECLRVANRADDAELLLADLRADALKRISARYVIAADGGSSPTRGQLGIGYSGRTYAERWVVIDTKVLEEWDAHDRLRFHCNPARPTVDCPTPLGHHRWEYPAGAGEDERYLVSDEAVWQVLRAQGITPAQVQILRAVVYSHHVRVADRWRVGRVFLAGDAAHAMPPWIGQGMSAGVRDAANLCWKLTAVLRGQAPEALLDSYAAERKPHVTEVIRRAVLVGRVITERRPWIAVARNHGLRALTKIPGVLGAGQRKFWIPDARYDDGFFCRSAGPAVGWQIPQPSIDGTPLDELLGGRWALLYTGALPAGATAWERIGVSAIRIAEPTLVRWLADRGADAVVLRPDGFIYAATTSGHPMPDPPVGLTLTTRTGAPA